MSDGQPQRPVGRICGARSRSTGRMCLRDRGHRHAHKHGAHIWRNYGGRIERAISFRKAAERFPTPKETADG